MPSVTTDNFIKVLNNIKKQYKENPEEQYVWVEALNNTLDELESEGFIGNNGEDQKDPRGNDKDDDEDLDDDYTNDEHEDAYDNY